MKKIITLFSLLLLLSCSKDDENNEVAPVDLVITNISPASGPKNTPVTIIGSGFSSVSSENAVTINGKVCPVINSTSTQLTITIPPSAGSGNIKVAVNNTSAESNNFDFIVTTTVTTIAGGASGFVDGQGSAARFDLASDLTIDSEGNLFVVDTRNNKIRKISPTGLVTTIAGSTLGQVDGQGILAKFGSPNGIAIDTEGVLFVSEGSSSTIRRISLTGFVRTYSGSLPSGFADGRTENAKFRSPRGMTIDASGNLFIADIFNYKIRKISINGDVTTVAGTTRGFADGQASNAQFDLPSGIVLDKAGNLFVADLGNHKIRKISPDGLVSTLAGSTQGFADGQGTAAKFNITNRITIDGEGNLFVSDFDKIRKISSTGLVTTVAGSTTGFKDGIGSSAQFNNIHGITIDKLGNLYVTDNDDTGSDRIRKITFD